MHMITCTHLKDVLETKWAVLENLQDVKQVHMAYNCTVTKACKVQTFYGVHAKECDITTICEVHACPMHC